MIKFLKTRKAGMIFLAYCLITISVNDMTRGQEPGSNVRDRARVYEPLIVRTATRYKVDARLLWTVAYLETRFRPRLISPKGARGIMQFMPATAAHYQLTNPHDPAQSIDAAARYLRDLQHRFGNRLDLVLAAYNAGEGIVEAYRNGRMLVLKNGKIINPGGRITGGVPPYKETRHYVLSGLAIFRELNAKRSSQQPLILKALTATAGATSAAAPTSAVSTSNDEAELEAIRENSLYAEESGHLVAGEQSPQALATETHRKSKTDGGHSMYLEN